MFETTEKRKKMILGLVFILAIFLITFHFTDTPKVWIDEGYFTEVAKNLATHGVLGLQTEPGSFFGVSTISVGYPTIFPVASSFVLFGTGLWQARLPMIIYMFLFVIIFYLFTKKRYGFYPAILSVLMLLSFAPFYGNGRSVLEEVPGLFFLLLGSLFLLYWEESSFQSKKWALFSGLSLGLAISAKPIYMIVLSVALVLTLLVWIRKIKNKKILLFFALGLIPPLLLWAYMQFPTIDSLIKIVPIYIHLGSNHTSSISVWQTVWTNFSKFFTESTPILFSLLLVTTILSLLLPRTLLKKFELNNNNNNIDKADKKRNWSIAEYLILSFIIINWLAYLFGTGWYRYFFPANVLAYLLFPASVLSLIRIFSSVFVKRVLNIILIILVLFQFTHLIFYSDTNFFAPRTKNDELSSALLNIDSEKKVLFYNTIEAIIFLKGSNYSQYLTVGDFLDMGNKDSKSDSSFDYILIAPNYSENISTDCYERKQVGGYYLFQKNSQCK